jgi:hypothetical protein
MSVSISDRLAAAAGFQRVSYDAPAWESLAARGLVTTKPLIEGQDIPVVVTLTDEGRAALEAAGAAR